MTQPARSPAPVVARITAADSVFEALLADIVRGVYPPRSRLPAERELSRILGASRPTIREALSRLAEWNLVAARRGSGVVVRDGREWNIEVLPAYLRFAGAAIEPKTLARMVRDLLTLRRQMIVECLRLVSDRIENNQLKAARDAVKHAWDSRHDPVTFAEEDFRVMRSILEAADFLPGVWLLNRLAGVYLGVARTLTGAITPPADYVLAHDRLLDALEDGDGAQAVQIIDTYLDNHDQRLLAQLGVTP